MEKLKQIEILDKECPLFINSPSKRSLRHNFFKNIKTEIQAYLLGFHAADGSVNNKRNTLRVKVTKKDSEIINLFKEFISPEAYTRDVKGFNTVIREKEVITKSASEINIASKCIVEDLNNFGFGERKTYKELKLPKIEESLLRHFIRGYFDGDGSFVTSIRKPNINNREKNYRVTASFSIESKKENILLEIKQFLSKFEINVNINYIKRDDMFRLVTSSKDNVNKLFHLLYDEANFYLNRKFNKFNYYVNTEVSQIIADHRNA